MTVPGIIGSLVLLLITVLVVGQPFLRRNPRKNNSVQLAEKQREHLLRFYEQCIASIRDLDDDFAEGKLLQHEYAIDREQWVQRGIQVLQALHELQKTQAPVEIKEGLVVDTALDAAIEDVIAAYAGARA